MSSAALRLVVLLGVAEAAPRQTVEQRLLVSNAIGPAHEASRQAEAEVLALFDSDVLRKYLVLFDDGTRLQDWKAASLVSRFWAEIGTAELVHSFGDPLADKDANCGFDLSIEQGAAAAEFFNQWQLQALGMVPVDGANNAFTEWTETRIFGYPPFANVSRPDIATSTDRPFYAALNMYRGAGGNPQCGPVSVVLSRGYLEGELLGAPVDTGFFYGACADGQTAGKFGNVTLALCGAWGGNRTLGTPPHLSHLLLPYLRFYNETEALAGKDYPAYKLARLLTRLLSRRTYATAQPAPLPLNFVENTLGYFELNPLALIDFPSGVKMLIGMFELLWGTPAGDRLRTWAVSRGWPLVWAYNPSMSFFRCGPAGDLPSCVFPHDFAMGADTAAARLLDPWVLQRVAAGHNVTVPPATHDAIEHAWRSTNASTAGRAELDAAWAHLVGDEERVFAPLAVEPLFHGACADEECVGVRTRTQECVC